MEQVAVKAVYKDWEKLSIKLGYLEADVQKFKNKTKAKKTIYKDLDTPKDLDTVNNFFCLFVILYIFNSYGN